MDDASTQFEFGEADIREIPSREIGRTSRHSGQRTVNAVMVGCKCGHVWRAQNQNGLAAVIGGYLVTCPGCRKSEMVNGKRLGL